MLESRLRERQPLSYLLSLLCLSRARAPARLIYIHTHTHALHSVAWSSRFSSHNANQGAIASFYMYRYTALARLRCNPPI